MLAGKLFCFSASKPDLKWIIDSGPTDHITPNLHYFSSYKPFAQDSFITMPNGEQAKIHHIGNIQLTPSLTLCNVSHVPDFHYNLLSASKLAKQLSAHVFFTPTTCYLQDHSMKQHLVIGRETSGLYFVDHQSCLSKVASSPISSFLPSSFVPSSKSSPQSNNNHTQVTDVFSFSCQWSPLELWHCRLGHMSYENMKHIDVISSCTSK